MNINLANIDFAPGQGGGGEAVIRSLDVTENGTYRAPSGVNGYNPVNVNVSGGGSVTPEEQAALDTLVNSSDGVLNTISIKSEGILKQKQNPGFTTSNWNRYLYDVDGDIYCKSDNKLFIYNPETLSFDYLFDLSQYGENTLWKDNSGRLYEGIYNQIDIENKTVTSVDLGGPYQAYGNSANIYKGKYGIYILADSGAYKFNEETQKFEVWAGTYTTDDQNQFNYYGSVKEYDGHIIIVHNSSFYELIETENSITIRSTNPYFSTTLPYGYGFESYNFYKAGDNYYYFVNNHKFKLVNNEWVSFAEDFKYYFDGSYQLVSSNGLFILNDNADELNGFILFNPGTSDYKKTLWNNISNIAVDLGSSQEIYGDKYFKGGVLIDNLRVRNIYNSNPNYDIQISSLDTSIVLSKIGNIELNCNYLLKNNTIVPTIDDIVVNKTITYPGRWMNEVTTASPITQVYNRVWTTASGRLFAGNYEWDFSTSNWIERSFNINIFATKSRIFTTSFGLVYLAPVKYGQIYVWNDSNTNWDLLYVNPSNVSASVSYYWVYGGDLYYRNYKKFDPNNIGWVDDEYCTNFSNILSMCNIGNDVYIRNNSCEVHKYNSSTKTFDRISQNQTFCNGYLFKYNNDLYVNDNEYVYKYNTSTDEFDRVDNIGVFNDNSSQNIYFEFDGKLYTVKNDKLGYLYTLKYNMPEVPASDGTYTLKAVRVGDQITYNWVLDAK